MVQKGESYTGNLLNFYNVINNLHSGNSVDEVSIDFQKAFGKVPHRALLYNLSKIEIAKLL